MRLVQFSYNNKIISAIVESENILRIINFDGGLYKLAKTAIDNKISLKEIVRLNLGKERFNYNEIIEEKLLLPPIVHPINAQCIVSGTGLTHLGSADTRDGMHNNDKLHEETDSMKMFQMGLLNGKPNSGNIGAQPEWFYKGDGSIVVPPEDNILSPEFAIDSGEEPELVGIYLNSSDGTPHRIGFSIGNEFSDHITEKENYLWLAHSKLRPCSFGPELFIDELPSQLHGSSKIIRNNKKIWEKKFSTGEGNMTHSIKNIEHHHFKYSQFRQPDFINIHFLGTSTLSFADNIKTKNGDIFEISIEEFGKPLRNTLIIENDISSPLVEVKTL